MRAIDGSTAQAKMYCDFVLRGNDCSYCCLLLYCFLLSPGIKEA